MSFLLDTNVISELRKGSRTDRSVARWFEANREERFYLSSVVVGEIRKGIGKLRPRDRAGAEKLEDWMGETRENFGDRIIPVDSEVAEEWGRISAFEAPPVLDGLIAATARVKGLTLVTRNTGDFQRAGVSCVNPFT